MISVPGFAFWFFSAKWLAAMALNLADLKATGLGIEMPVLLSVWLSYIEPRSFEFNVFDAREKVKTEIWWCNILI